MMFGLHRHVLAILLAAGGMLASECETAAQTSKPSKPPPAPSCNRENFRVVLDVGHTAEEPGAISVRSVSEYEFNLALARQIEQGLQQAGFKRTHVLVTSGPAQRGLVKRVLDTNALKADLLLSVHHDSVPDWLLQHMDENGGPRRFSDRFAGHSIFVSHENADRAGSLEFARMLGRRLKIAGLQFTPHYTDRIMRARQRELLDKEVGVYRFDKLYVLRAAQMPAVLLEAGMIINPSQEPILASEDRRKLVGRAAKEAVEIFCAWRASPVMAEGKRK
jgi:N-acetylmuramoyl-L-alanine amidase